MERTSQNKSARDCRGSDNNSDGSASADRESVESVASTDESVASIKIKSKLSEVSPRAPNFAMKISSPVKAHPTNNMHGIQTSNFCGDNIGKSGNVSTTYSTPDVIEALLPVAKLSDLIDVQMESDGALKSVKWQNGSAD